MPGDREWATGKPRTPYLFLPGEVGGRVVGVKTSGFIPRLSHRKGFPPNKNAALARLPRKAVSLILFV